MKTVILQAILLLQISTSIHAKNAKCEIYRGRVCDRLDYRGEPIEYSIPFGQTQDAIDLEIKKLVASEPYKYLACEEYFKHLLCKYKYQRCRLPPTQGANKKVPYPPCRRSCSEALNSICLKTLKPGSLLSKWVKKTMVCTNFPSHGASYCEAFDLKWDQDIFEFSCMYENTNRSDEKNVVTASVLAPLRAYEKPLDIKKVVKKILQKHFPTKLPADTKCYTQNCHIHDFLYGRKIQFLPNFKRDGSLKDFRVPVYCESPSTKIKIFPFASKQSLYTPDRYLTLKELNYAIVDDGTNVHLAGYGCFDICFKGNFKYNVIQENKDVTVYTAESEKAIQMKWLEIFFQLSSMPHDMRYILQLFNFIPSFVFKNLKWTSFWKNKTKVNLLQDSKTSTVLKTGQREERNVTLEQSEILIGSRHNFWSVYFELTELDLVDFARTVLPSQFFSFGAQPLIEKSGINDLFQTDLIEYFMKTNGDFTSKIPTSPLLDKAKVVIYSRQTTYSVIAKVFGKVSQTSKNKPSWLDATSFQLTYVLTKDLKSEFHLEFEHQQSSCQSTQKDWTNFDKVIDSLKEWQKCYCREARKVEKVIKCEKCCNLNEDRVVSIKVYDIWRVSLSMNITMRNRATETTHIFKNVGIHQLQVLPDLFDDTAASGSSPGDCEKDCPATI